MHSAALDFVALAKFSGAATLVFLIVYVVLKRMIDGAPTIPVIEDADIDDLTDPDVPAYLLEADDFVDAVPTPAPHAETDGESATLVCGTCCAYQSRLTLGEPSCWFCGAPLAARKAS